jgi:hypothetical protein
MLAMVLFLCVAANLFALASSHSLLHDDYARKHHKHHPGFDHDHLHECIHDKRQYGIGTHPDFVPDKHNLVTLQGPEIELIQKRAVQVRRRLLFCR